MTTRNTVNVIEGTVTVVEVITAGPQGALGGGGGAGTDLSWDATTRTVASSTGTDAVITEATTTLPGLMSAADKALVNQAATVTVAVRNNSGVAIPKGAAVYVTGTSGTTITVALADASTEATAAQTLGLAQASIANNSNGTVIAVGELTGLDTSGLTEGAIVWLSETTGALTTTRPTQPAHGVVLGYCVKSGPGTSGIVYVKVDNGLELEELHDVLITSATTDQALMKAADGLWKNKTITPALIGAATAAQGAKADAAAVAGLISSSGVTMTAGILARETGTGAPQVYSIGSGLAISGGALVVTAGGTGTVTSVGLSLPGIFSVTGSPVTTAGTLAATLATQAANLVFAGPSSGAAAAPTFRQLGYSELTGLPTLGTAAALSVGTTAGTVAAGDDSRLSDQRTPLDGSVTDAKIAPTGLAAGSVNWTNIQAWAPSTAYSKGDLVEYLGIAYRRAVAGTSGTTFNNANWNQTTPSAVMSHGHATFTSSSAGYVPASGGGQINFLRADGTFAAPPGGGFAGYAVNNWIQPVVGITASSASSVAATIYLYPFEVRRSITVSDLGARVNTPTASSNFQLAVYASSASGVPTGNPLGATGSLSGATAGVVSSTLASSFNLTAGQIYWAAYNADATIAMNTFTATTLYTSSILGAPNLSDVAAGASNGWLRTTGYLYANGSWPDLTSVTTSVLSFSVGNRTALVYLKVSALL